VLAKNQRAERQPDRGSNIADLAEIDRPANLLEPEEQRKHRRSRGYLQHRQCGHCKERADMQTLGQQRRKGGKKHSRYGMAAHGQLQRSGILGPVNGAVDVACGQRQGDEQRKANPAKRGWFAQTAARCRDQKRSGKTRTNPGHTQRARLLEPQRRRNQQRADRR